MKADKNDFKKYSEAIDKIQEGNESMIELFNELEDDDPLINFGHDVVENIGKAKEKFGDETIDEKINSVVREMLSWLHLNDEENPE
ncbi:voltage-gated potassium channel [Salibacterium salarium]|uniref:atypical membrane-integrating protein (Mistic protein) n=1 Tax=Salibacterium salarium TaxID=284579 RepID=UPI00277F0F2E|nr:atypical membrane-integrating protein (Mistic protein) [Salibacterium salarium]MDQ0299223.1 voltage-gated potassium channel [Salibacterium salarium]